VPSVVAPPCGALFKNRNFTNMKKILLTFVSLFIFLSITSAEIKVSYIGGNLSFSFVSSTFTEIEIKKDSIDPTKSLVSVIFGTMTIKNDGDTNFDASLLISTETKGCRIVTGEPSREKDFRFFALFSNNLPGKSSFNDDDILSGERTIATSEVFAIPDDEKNLKGYDIEPGSTRTVYFRIDVSTNVSSLQAIFNLNVTAVSSEYSGEEIGSSGGEIEIYNRIKIEFPQGALSGNKEISIIRKTSALLYKRKDDIDPVCGYEFFPSGLVFRKPVKLTIFYKYENVSQDKEDSLRIYFWDGVEWRFAGGLVDKNNKSVSTYISHFSIYALFPTVASVSYKPKEKILTPATKDGINDVATFDGLAGTDVEIDIFDISGRPVRKIDVLSDGNIWDGQDNYGNLVESGVYIYQFKVEGKTYSGTIIIAK